MKVVLSFDVEIWCNGWQQLDRRFPASFERYVYGHSRHGDYALPATLRILQEHGLRGVFFVEPLFAARFGAQHLRTIVQMIQDAGQEVQLHLHPEWTDEIRPALIDNVRAKRQHLTQYTLDEQTRLIGHGRQALLDAGCPAITAFRAGSYAANRDTYLALARNGILVDSSLNAVAAVSGPDVERPARFSSGFRVGEVASYPVTVFRDGFGRWRPAQVGACSAAELRDAMHGARRAGCRHFVIVSHNFELLKPGRSEPDWIVVKRFEALCRFLAEQGRHYSVCSYPVTMGEADLAPEGPGPRSGVLATARRHAEQLVRRWA